MDTQNGLEFHPDVPSNFPERYLARCYAHFLGCLPDSEHTSLIISTLVCAQLLYSHSQAMLNCLAHRLGICGPDSAGPKDV